jgi:hypothetical protein
MHSMKSLDLTSMFSRLAQSKLAHKVADELGGEAAQANLLIEAGYAGQPDGIATRIALEIEKALPLNLSQSALQIYGRHFNGTEVMAASRREAEDMLSSFPAQMPQPSSQLSLTPRGNPRQMALDQRHPEPQAGPGLAAHR